jgi:hypothetical protein
MEIFLEEEEEQTREGEETDPRIPREAGLPNGLSFQQASFQKASLPS